MPYLKNVFSLAILLGSVLAFMVSQAAESLDRIVAVVNTSVITQQQLAEQIELTRQQLQAENKPVPSASVMRKQVLEQMIDIELQRELAESLGLRLDETALDKAIADIATRNGLTVRQLRSRLEQEKLPYSQYRQRIRAQLIVSRLQQDEVAQKITVSPQEIADMLAHRPQQSSAGKTVYYVEDLLVPLPNNPSSQTLVSTKQTALSLLQVAKNGSSFQQLIEQSKNASLPLSGGDMGWRQLGEFPDIFQSSIRSLAQGEVAGPFQAENGFHLIRLIKSRGENSNDASRTVMSSHIRHILIKTSPLLSDSQAEKRLREIRAEILRGGSFAALAKQYSQDTGSAFEGGDLGWTLPGVFDPAFEAQVNKLPIQQLSLPFRTPFGWHIAEVLGRSKKLQTPQALAYDQAKQLVYQKKFQQALENWLRLLRQQAYVKIM